MLVGVITLLPIVVSINARSHFRITREKSVVNTATRRVSPRCDYVGDSRDLGFWSR
jgi:hypothetical protein